MSTEATDAGTGAVLGKIIAVWSAIGGSIVLPTVAQWEQGLRIIGIVLGCAYTGYMLLDLHQRRRRDQARREAGQDTQRDNLR